MSFKFLLLFFLLFDVSVALAQKDSMLLRAEPEITSHATEKKLFLKIDFISTFRRPIDVIAETSVGEFKCNFNAGVWIYFESLDGTCFKERGPDCTVPLDINKAKKIMRINYRDSISYKFDISNYVSRKAKGDFAGVHRFKVHHRYLLSGVWHEEDTDWIYLNLTNNK